MYCVSFSVVLSEDFILNQFITFKDHWLVYLFLNWRSFFLQKMQFQARSLPRSTFEPDVNAELENKPLTIARPVYLESENRAEKRYVKKEKEYSLFFCSFITVSILLWSTAEYLIFFTHTHTHMILFQARIRPEYGSEIGRIRRTKRSGRQEEINCRKQKNKVSKIFIKLQYV